MPTLLRSLQIPAMFRAAPFGFAASGGLAGGAVDVLMTPIALERVEHVVGAK